MHSESENSSNEVVKVVEMDGHRLTIVARRSFEKEWELCILNERGVVTNWMEIFESAQLALDAGEAAIDEEGVEAFTSVEGFDYLNDQPTVPLRNH